MEQLIKITSEPFQFIRFTQNAKLVPENSLDLERRKAVARHYAFQSRFRRSSFQVSEDVRYINKINRAFSQGVKQTVSAPEASSVESQEKLASMSLSRLRLPVTQPFNDNAYESSAPIADPVPVKTRFSSGQDAQSFYIMERGSFEMRVAKGEVTFVPPLVMTIVTQYPDIHFEYTAGFHYFPPQDSTSGGNFNLFV